MNICIDIDGTMTVRDYYIPFFNCFFHKNIKFTQMVEYDLQKVYGVSEEQIIDFYQKCGHTMHPSAGIQENVVKTLLKWQKNHDVSIVTARTPEMKEVTVNWLDKKGLGKVPLHLLGTSKKTEFAKLLKCDLFIEDHPEEIKRMANSGIRTLLMDNPYNQNITHKNIVRVNDWYEIEKIVDTMN